MLFVTNDEGRWGSGVGPVTAAQHDQAHWELKSAIANLIANPATPNQVTAISAAGSQFTFHMSNGTDIGPVSIPVVGPHWRGAWATATLYEFFDILTKPGVGLYMVLQDHLSVATFDPNMTANGQPVYLLMFAFAPSQNLNDAIGFSYPGPLSEVSSTYLFQEPMTRATLLPVVPVAGTSHQAWMQIPATSNAQTFNVYKNGVLIGTVTFAVAAQIGVVTITADTTFAAGDRLAVGNALVPDITAAELSVVFAAQQVAL